MIPQTHITIDGDVALVVFDGLPDLWVADYRPCDTCGGDSELLRPDDSVIGVCADCDGTGRHTFTVETVNMGTPYQPAAPHYRTLRVHVLDAEPIPDNAYLDHPKLPPAAEPGMWLVRLAVHS